MGQATSSALSCVEERGLEGVHSHSPHPGDGVGGGRAPEAIGQVLGRQALLGADRAPTPRGAEAHGP